MKISLIPTCIVLTISCATACRAEPPMPGGATVALVTKKEVMDAAAFAIKAEDKALQDTKGTPTTKLELIEILEAKEPHDDL